MSSKLIIGNTAIQFIGRVISAVLAIISIKLITSYLGVEGYGMYTTVYEFVGLFAIIGDIGLYTIAIREMAENKESKAKIYHNVLAMRALFTFIVMIFVGVGGMFIPAYQDTLIPLGIWLCTIAVWINLFYSIVNSILQYHLKMQWATLSLIIGKIIAVISISATVFFIQNQEIGFLLLVTAGIIGHLVMLVISLYFVARIEKIRLEFDWQFWKGLLKKSWPYGVALILGTIYFKVDVTLISVLRDSKEVGFYGVPLRMIEVLNVLPLFLMNSVLGSLSQAIKKSKEETNKMLHLAFKFLILAIIPIIVFTYFFAEELVIFVSSTEFLSTATTAGADTVLLLLVIAMSFYFFSTFISFSLVAFHQQMKVLYINAFGAIFNLLTNLYFIPIYGFIGAAYTSIASEVLILIISFILLKKVFPFVLPKMLIFKLILITTVLFSIFYFILPFIAVASVLFKLIVGFVVLCSSYFILLKGLRML